MNVGLYVDYENFYKRLKEYGLRPIENLNFFTSITKKFKESGNNIIKLIAFANFEDPDFEILDQTKIHSFGVDVKHCSIDGKSSTDIELTIEVMKDLYCDRNIDVFVIISNDKDYLPLFNMIKSEGKLTYSLTTKNGYSDIYNVFTDYHQFIEDLYCIEGKALSEGETRKGVSENAKLTEDMIEKSRKVASMFYGSDLWSRLKESDTPISLKGYSSQIKKVWSKETLSDIESYFHIAHSHNFIELFERDGKLCIRQGKLIGQFITGVEDQKPVAI